MQTWIALLRGINVGGKNKVPMAKLSASLERLKLKNIRTYIQSGNVVFESNAKTSASLSKKIAQLVEQEFGFRPKVMVISHLQLLAAIEANPFIEPAASDPKNGSLLLSTKTGERTGCRRDRIGRVRNRRASAN